MSLKGLTSVHRRCHHPPKGLDTNGTESNMASEHARKHEARVKKKEFRLDSNESGFICDGVRNVDGYKRNA